jgi:SAM-dependent methyltransferase
MLELHSHYVMATCRPGTEMLLRAEWERMGLLPSFQASGLVTAKATNEIHVDSLPQPMFGQRVCLSIGKGNAPAGPWRHHVSSDVHDGELLLSRIDVGAQVWWGLHRHRHDLHPAPLGQVNQPLPATAPSRAWHKLEDACLRFGVAPSGTVVEVGCAPGGVTRALLDRGCRVLGVDPNAMDPRIAADARFRHIRCASARARLDELDVPVDWLIVDVNVPPGTALAGVRPFLRAQGRRLQGVLFTVKLKDWSMAFEELPQWRARLSHWTDMPTRAAHLPSNHQEICVIAGPRHRSHADPHRGA